MDWATGVFTVYQADMVNLGGGIYELDVPALKLELGALQARRRDGITFPDIFQHNTTVTVGVTTLVRVLLIINGYTMAISPAGAYQVSCKGANHNLGDVYANLTGPTFLPNNSAGLVITAGGGGGPTAAEIADAVLDEPRDEHNIPGTYGEDIILKKTTEAPDLWKQE
jgi:hypothetical protein